MARALRALARASPTSSSKMTCCSGISSGADPSRFRASRVCAEVTRYGVRASSAVAGELQDARPQRRENQTFARHVEFVQAVEIVLQGRVGFGRCRSNCLAVGGAKAEDEAARVRRLDVGEQGCSARGLRLPDARDTGRNDERLGCVQQLNHLRGELIRRPPSRRDPKPNRSTPERTARRSDCRRAKHRTFR